eukprot:TRINITY_DN5077_c2_g2_i2.p2 TRINITY_DN5077_c2_g2~~TRINITY_DN5077_c2_g2_i2.p2  ORF type:complete len:178 (+),score=42.64 TRINITY_DN5077_c2_g2_i2:225-758(+)
MTVTSSSFLTGAARSEVGADTFDNCCRDAATTADDCRRSAANTANDRRRSAANGAVDRCGDAANTEASCCGAADTVHGRRRGAAEGADDCRRGAAGDDQRPLAEGLVGVPARFIHGRAESSVVGRSKEGLSQREAEDVEKTGGAQPHQRHALRQLSHPSGLRCRAAEQRQARFSELL